MILSFDVMVQDTAVPVSALNIAGASVGNTGHLSATSGMKALAAAGVDLVALSIKDPGSLPVQASVTIDDVTTPIFGGEYLNAKFNYNAQEVTFHARDWAGPLVDQKRVLVNILAGNNEALAPSEKTTKGVSTQNQKLSQIITAVAEQFSLIPDLRLATGANGDPNVGTVFGDANDVILGSTPQSLWAILTRLARDSGNVVYVTPQRHLVFGEPGAGLEPISLMYRVNPIPPGAHGAISLSVDHNPRRNLTFRVTVLSYDHTNSAVTKGQAFVIGSDYGTDGGGTVHAGAWSGDHAQQISKAIGSGPKSKKNAIPVYTYHLDGLTAAQAQQQAAAIAADISKRELIAHTITRCIPDLQPSNPATLGGLINPEFAAHQYFVTNYQHAFSMSQSGHATFETHMTLLDRQPAGKGDPVSGGSS